MARKSVIVLGVTLLLLGCSEEKKTMNYALTPLAFNLTSKQIDDACKSETEKLNRAVDTIGKRSLSQATFENTVLALERAAAEFSNRLNPTLFLKYVSSSADIRAAADVCENAVQQMMVDLYMREDIFTAFNAVKKTSTSLTKLDAFLLDEYLVNFRRNGLELSQADRKTFGDKKKRLVLIESEFSKNLVEWEDNFDVTLNELAGLPKSFIDSLEKTGDGKYRLTMAYPHYFGFMENASNADARRRFEQKFYNRGGEKNRALIEEAIQLRDELAKMLGFRSHAHFVLDRRMAKTPESVVAFLDKLASKLKPKGRADIDELLVAKRKDDPSATQIESSDWRYYDTILKRTKFQVDTQKIKEYFPLDVVLKGMFEIYQTLLGVSFVEEKNANVWHESVKGYQIVKNGVVIGKFFMDLFPREGKYGHAAAFTLVSGYEDAPTTYVAPISSIVANFNKPSPGKPSLLEHSEVETLFHEFGHIMHQTLTTAKYASLSGTSVKTDFVEAPSQMLENWVWNESSLAKLSGHYLDNSKPLPKEQINKLVLAKHLNSGIRYLRQLSFATIDMAYHTSGPKVDSTSVYAKITNDTMMIPVPNGTLPQASFGHLMGGYDSGYYGYLWSEVYAQDMFSRFENEGMLNPTTGADYLKWILQPGGTQDPFELIKGFLGREPNEAAFLKDLGI